MEVRRERLDTACKQGLRPTDAVQRWVGAPEDPIGGYIAADASVCDAPNLDTLYERTNPGGPSAPGPLIQDGEFPDGTPVNRAEGWGPLGSMSAIPYPTITTAEQSNTSLPVEPSQVAHGFHPPPLPPTSGHR